MLKLRPTFTMGAIFKSIEHFKRERERKTKLVLQFVGETIVNLARTNHGYIDQTGNLTSSIGYAVVNNNKIVDLNIEGEEKGQRSALNSIEQWIAENPFYGWRLVVTAGMNYAASVEAKGYDVLSNSVLSSNELLAHFKKELSL